MTDLMSYPAHLAVRRLTVERLACTRGGREILSGLGLRLGPGEALVLKGPNGVGKSSLLMCLAGLLEHSGKIVWHGQGEQDRPGADIHFLSHLPAVKPHLGVRHNLEFWADLNEGDRALAGPALDQARLGHAADLSAGLLSAGQVRRLALCRLLVAPRPVWLLDEPTAALDTQGDAWVGKLIDTHLGAGGLAVIASHLPLKLQAKPRTLVLGRLG